MCLLANPHTCVHKTTQRRVFIAVLFIQWETDNNLSAMGKAVDKYNMDYLHGDSETDS